MNEIDILNVAGSRHVASIIDVFEDSSNIFIVQELIEGMNMLDFLSTRIRENRIVKLLMRSLFEGLEYLHSIGIVHRDIKLENIMVQTRTN